MLASEEIGLKRLGGAIGRYRTCLLSAPQTPPAPPLAEAAVTPGKDERMWAMFCHLGAFAGYVVPVPFAAVIGPLVLWLIKRDS